MICVQQNMLHNLCIQWQASEEIPIYYPSLWQQEINQITSHQSLLQYNVQIYLRYNTSTTKYCMQPIFYGIDTITYKYFNLLDIVNIKNTFICCLSGNSKFAKSSARTSNVPVRNITHNLLLLQTSKDG